MIILYIFLGIIVLVLVEIHLDINLINTILGRLINLLNIPNNEYWD